MENQKEKSESSILETRIIKRLRIYIAIIILISILIIYELIQGHFNIPLAIIGIIIGWVIGIFVSRMYVLSWDDDENIIVSHMDGIGAVILVFYLIFVINKSKYFGYWVQGTPLFDLVISVTLGTMIGRILGTRSSIKKVLRALKIEKLIDDNSP
ncbi:hypothetical protein [Methanobacterium alcaliphilum]|uniref:hypothetical protein n=1 Tax=Methanobacterium alcaliphilum TaxID=392018 RepID=UPI00200B165E|nr:hypothetical protein [Methanobacterium alcaliphilum]MCK9150967.1 hypothetical protein [Methanobacterium alcaliphilum]